MLLVEENGSNDDAILIVSDKKSVRREVDLVKKNGTDLVEMGIFEEKTVDSDDQKVKSINFSNYSHELIGSIEFTKMTMV